MATYKKLLKNRNGDNIIPVTDADTYSTTEKKVGVWIDGKPIYRKSFTYSYASGSTWRKFGEISNLGTFIGIFGSFHRTDGNITDCPICKIE